MARSIKIFKSFEEQEQYNIAQMKLSTVHQRFKELYQMQLLSGVFRHEKDVSRKIIIRQWIS